MQLTRNRELSGGLDVSLVSSPDSNSNTTSNANSNTVVMTWIYMSLSEKGLDLSTEIFDQFISVSIALINEHLSLGIILILPIEGKYYIEQYPVQIYSSLKLGKN